MVGETPVTDARFMSAAVLIQVAPAASTRILADVSALAAPRPVPREPALERLEQALGREFADRLVAALSETSDQPRH
jgi:predicted secreted protein